MGALLAGQRAFGCNPEAPGNGTATLKSFIQGIPVQVGRSLELGEDGQPSFRAFGRQPSHLTYNRPSRASDQNCPMEMGVDGDEIYDLILPVKHSKRVAQFASTSLEIYE